MKASKDIINFDKLINLFFLFVVGTISFMVHQLVQLPDFGWKEGFRFAILLLGVFSYESVLISLVSHYLSNARKKVAKLFDKYPNTLYYIIIVVLSLTYIIIDTLIEKSLLKFLRAIFMVSLIIVALPNMNKFFKRKK